MAQTKKPTTSKQKNDSKTANHENHDTPKKLGAKVTVTPSKKASTKIATKAVSSITAIKSGHVVSVDYVGTLSNGEEFDNSKNNGPISFIVGQNQVIKGFDNAVIGMKPNEKKKFTIKKEEAYGDVNPALVHKVPLDKLPPEIKQQLKVGGFLVMQSPTGQQIPAKVTGLDKKEVSLDLNHPLAGKDLTFEITIKDIRVAEDSDKQGCGDGCSCDHDNEGHDDSDCCGGGCCK